MSALVFNVIEAFRFVNHPVLKDYGQRLHHKAKKVYQKVKKALRSPKDRRVHCKTTPPPPQRKTIAIQTSFESLIQTLSHEGELDMSHHRASYLNTNQNNSRGVSRPVRTTGLPTSRNSGHSSRNVLPNKPLMPVATKPTSSVGTSTGHMARINSNQKISSKESGSTSRTSSTLPKIPRSTSPVPRRRSYSFSSNRDILRPPPHSVGSNGASSSRAQLYLPHPPSSTPPMSPARVRRREVKSQSTAPSSRELLVKAVREPSKPHEKQVSRSEQASKLNHPHSGTSLRRTASLSSIHTSFTDIAQTSRRFSEDLEDHLHSESTWGSNPIPEFLKVNISSQAKAETTPVTSTLVPTEKRNVKCVVDASKAARESPRRESTSSGSKFLRSRVKSQGTQVSLGIDGALISGGVVGLNNLGNTCFMNSMLQCLSHTVEMTQIFLHTDSLAERKTGLSKAYTQLMQEIWFPDKSPFHIQPSLSKVVNPRELKTAIARVHSLFAGTRQHDSQEFLRLLVSELHEEMKPNKKDVIQFSPVSDGSGDSGEELWQSYFRFEDTPISRVFMGQLRSTLTCTVCETASKCFDPFWDLALPLPKSSQSSCFKDVEVKLEQCLDRFTKEEVMDGDNKTYCAHCRKNQKSYKQMTINRFPPVLVLDLKRFSGFGFRNKLDTVVDVPLTLDFTKYASKEAAADKYSGRRIKYELYAMSNHSGSVSFGHYTAVVKHFATKQWYLYNDSRVTKLHSLDRYLKSCEPYVLFYRRALSDD